VLRAPGEVTSSTVTTKIAEMLSFPQQLHSTVGVVFIKCLDVEN
jgi:hypothetical protein